ncbi:ABC transporter substrate-binding protein [Anaerovorax odorimutans]|uniref:ABC transporter substrate-binding protein n=1 Tax=Anaerovorax odorimutans TaxID=109327 RepID=UPI0003F70771|nr:ABC transporter substrate-binding protein [Anaerovorax odorimutans]
MKKVALVLLTAMIMGTIALSGCGNSGTTTGSSAINEAEANGEKEVVIGIYRDALMDEMDAASYRGPHFVYKMIYEGLVEDGGEEGIIPQLATSWDIDPDGKTYTFHLKEGVKFSDGSDFNADNVVFNMKRWINNDRHSSLTSNKVDSVEALDEYTVKIVFTEAAYSILNELTYPRPVRFLSENAVEPIKGDALGTFLGKPIGTGQWMFESYTKDEEFTLVPNPYYWGEKPKVDRIRFKVIVDGQARLMALKSGEIDIIGGDLMGKIPMESIVDVRDGGEFDFYNKPTMCSHFMFFNQHNELLQNKNIRLAFNYAIDKEDMVTNLFNGVGAPADDGLYQPTVPYTTEKNNYSYDCDKEKAKELFEQAGLADTDGDGILEKDGQNIELKLTLSADEFPEWKSMAEYVQYQLMEVGIKVNLNILDANGYEDAHMNTKDYDLCFLRTSSDSWVPHSSIRELFMPLSSLNGDCQVWMDDTLMRYIQKTLLTLDETKRQASYDKVFSYISENVLTVPLYYPVTAFAVNGEKVTKFEPGVNNYAPVNWTTLDVK